MQPTASIVSLIQTTVLNFTKLYHILAFLKANTWLHYTKKWSCLLRISSVNVTKSAENCGLVTFTEEMLTGKLHFLCSVNFIYETLVET